MDWFAHVPILLSDPDILFRLYLSLCAIFLIPAAKLMHGVSLEAGFVDTWVLRKTTTSSWDTEVTLPNGNIPSFDWNDPYASQDSSKRSYTCSELKYVPMCWFGLVWGRLEWSLLRKTLQKEGLTPSESMKPCWCSGFSRPGFKF